MGVHVFANLLDHPRLIVAGIPFVTGGGVAISAIVLVMVLASDVAAGDTRACEAPDQRASPLVAPAEQADIDQAIAKSDRTRALLEEGATSEEYRAAVNGDVEGMTADRWKLISKNFRADATEDLKQSDLRVFPILADHDLNVDVADTRQVYTRVLPPDQLEVKTYSEATHDLVKKEIADSTLRTYATAIFNPRGLFVSGFLSDQQAFLEQSTKACS